MKHFDWDSFLTFDTSTKTMDELMKMTGKPQTTIHMALKSKGLTYKKKHEKVLTDEHRAKISLLDTPNLTTVEIAKITGVSRKIIYQYLNNYKIPYKGKRLSMPNFTDSELFFSWEDYPYGIF